MSKSTGARVPSTAWSPHETACALQRRPRAAPAHHRFLVGSAPRSAPGKLKLWFLDISGILKKNILDLQLIEFAEMKPVETEGGL